MNDPALTEAGKQADIYAFEKAWGVLDFLEKEQCSTAMMALVLSAALASHVSEIGGDQENAGAGFEIIKGVLHRYFAMCCELYGISEETAH